MAHQEHLDQAKKNSERIQIGVLTISDTRTKNNDTSGKQIIDTFKADGQIIERYAIVADEPSQILPIIDQWIHEGTALIITNGGTGIAPRDRTIDAIEPTFDKTLTGFGELFRMRSYQEIGASAMLSRAIAGTRGQTIIFCLPGSTGAVKLAIDEFIRPQLEHIIWQLHQPTQPKAEQQAEREDQ